MDILRIISFKFFLFYSAFSTEPLRSLKARVEVLNHTLITTYKTKSLANRHIWAFRQDRYMGALKCENYSSLA